MGNQRTLNDIIIESPRDKNTLDYILRIRSNELVLHVINNLIHPNKRLYVSNIAKALDIEIPDHALANINEDKQARLDAIAELKKKLNFND